MTDPALVLVAHGTRSTRGVEMVAELAAAVARELTTPVRTAFVDVLGPSPAEVLRDLAVHPVCPATAPTYGPGTSQPFGPGAAETFGPGAAQIFGRGAGETCGPGTAETCGPGTLFAGAIVVPAFLASGYHVYQDVPREVAESGHPAVAVTPALGPDPALARIMRIRLLAAGWRPGDAVVFAAAGSSDPRARADVRRAADLLADRLDTPVHRAYIATGAPRVADVVARLRDSGERRVFIASYLLAHGLFQQRLHEAGADGVAEPIGVHPAVVRLLAARYHTAARELAPVR